jgi:4-hydroxybenzoate polyprenyltransferase
MKRWLTFMNERAPIPAVLMIGAGVSASGVYLAGHFDLRAFLIGTLAQVIFLILLRVMDERKDFEKDKVAHPDRPLPRGLLTVADIDRSIVVLAVVMFALAAVAGVVVNPVAGGFLAVGALYLWLMFKEFYVGERLASYPMIYALSHQIIEYPIYGFVVVLVRPDLAFARPMFAYIAMNIGASMTFEIARKLDPTAAPILKTYLSLYGPPKTAALLALFMVVAGIGSYALGILPLTLPSELLVIACLPVLFKAPGKYRVLEGASAFSSFMHVFGVAFHAWFGWPR